MIIPEREATAAERAKWESVLQLAEQTKRQIFANVLRAENYKIVKSFAAAHGVTIGIMPDADQQRLVSVISEFNRIQRLISYVERLELGVRFENGEVSIVAPPSYTDDQIAALSGWFIPIAIGIVLLAGLIGKLHGLEDENEEIAAKYKAVLTASEKRICSDPYSSECKAWKEEKEPIKYQQNTGLIDRISSGITEIGQTAKKGLGIGLAIAIPLLAWSYFGARR